MEFLAPLSLPGKANSSQDMAESGPCPLSPPPSRMSHGDRRDAAAGTHQRGSFSPKHRQLSGRALLPRHLGCQHHRDLHRAAGLDDPAGRGAGVPHGSALLVLLPGTEMNMTSERPRREAKTTQIVIVVNVKELTNPQEKAKRHKSRCGTWMCLASRGVHQQVWGNSSC